MAISKTGFLCRSTTLGAVNTPVSIAALIAALSPAWDGSPAFEILIVSDDGSAGNLVMTDNSAAASETGGVVVGNNGIGAVGLGPTQSIMRAVNPQEMYLISATLNKPVVLIGVPKV